jgi:class 3 adenylate cyclase
MKTFLLILFLGISSVVCCTEEDEIVQSEIASEGQKKVDQMMRQFESLFTQASSKSKNANKEKIIQLGERMLAEAVKTKYRKAEIICYKKLADMYKFYKNPNQYLKYNLKYKQNKKELERLERAEIARIKRQQAIKEAEIKKLELDKNLNKELIELKKAELNATKSALDQTIYEIQEKDNLISKKEDVIVENQSIIKEAYDSILQAKRANQALEYDKKILQDEKKFAELSEKAAKSRNWMFVLIGAIALLIAAFMGILLIYMRKNQAKLKEKNDLIATEKQRSDELLLNILPPELANELKRNGFAKAQSFENVTVFFSDFKDFTKISKQLTPAELVKEIDACFKAFDKIIENYNIEKIKTVGDAYICVGGLDKTKKHKPQEIIDAAIEIRNFVSNRIEEHKKLNKVFFEVRIGVHSGPIVAGIVGFKKFAYDIWGDTVNTAARMEENSEPGKINVSASTFEKIKDDYSFTYRGKIPAKNQGKIDMYFIHDRKETV